MKEAISTDKAPQAIGPYSQAIRAGSMFFFSGQIPLNPETGQMVDGGIDAQIDQVLANMQGALSGAGLSTDHVVKVTIYLSDIAHFDRVNEKYGAVFCGSAPPARAVVEVAALPKGALIEVEWIAVAPNA